MTGIELKDILPGVDDENSGHENRLALNKYGFTYVIQATSLLPPQLLQSHGQLMHGCHGYQ